MFFSTHAGGVTIALLMGTHIGVKEIKLMLFPIWHNEWWFITSYAGLLLLAPYLNGLAHSFNRRTYTSFLLTLIGMLTIYSWKNDIFHVGSGYSLLWFIVLYYIGGYIGRYNISFSRKYLFLGYICFSLLTWSLNIGAKTPKWYLYDYNAPLVLASSLCLFLLFKNIRIESPCAAVWISRVAPLMLGVYLIHEHPFIRPLVWTQIVKAPQFYDSPWFLLHFLISTTAVFLGAACIEWGRQRLFQWLGQHMPEWIYQRFFFARDWVFAVASRAVEYMTKMGNGRSL